jgi:hypothetical protein
VSAFITHDGSGMPVDPMTRVIPQFRADQDSAEADAAAADYGVSAHTYLPWWQWDAGSTDMADIVAYRVVQP